MTMKKATVRLPQFKIEEGSWLKIGEVLKRSDVGVEALRFYEKSGLIDPPGRTGVGYRQYDASVLDRLEFIKRAQALGFTLNEIAQIIAENRAGHSSCGEVREIVRVVSLAHCERPGRRGERDEEGFASYLAPFHRGAIARRRRADAQGVQIPWPQRPEDHGQSLLLGIRRAEG